MFDSINEVLDFAGVKSVGNLASPQRSSYIYTIDWSTSIAAGGSSESNVEIDSGSVFVVEELRFVAWLPAAAGGVAAFTPLYDQSAAATAAANTFDSEAALRLDLRTQHTRFTSNANGVRVPLLTGKAQRQAWEQAPMVLPGGQSIIAKLYNDSGQTIQAQLALKGTRWRV